MARVYDAEGADELTFLDITASSGDRATTYDVVSRTAESVFIPLTVGGGVRSPDDVDRLLRAGADKVARQHRRRRPAGADRRDRRPVRQPGARAVARRPPLPGRRAARSPASRSPPTAAAAAPAGTPSSGASGRPSWAPGRSCSTRWTPTAPAPGFDTELIRQVRREVSVPLIASGGAGARRALPARRRGRRRRRAGRERLPLRRAAHRRRQGRARRRRHPGPPGGRPPVGPIALATQPSP